MRRVSLLLLALAGCAPEASEPTEYTGDLVLVDDGASDPGFATFRDSLRAITARRDTAALLAIVAEDARLSYDDVPGGAEGLRRMWFETDPSESLWTVLERMLDGGSVDEDGAVTIPSVSVLWPENVDLAGHVAVPGQRVPAYDAPGGAVIAEITETTLSTTGPQAGGWCPVSLPDGRAAVVETHETLNPLGYRAVFWDDGDGWRLRSLLSHDGPASDAPMDEERAGDLPTSDE